MDQWRILLLLTTTPTTISTSKNISAATTSGLQLSTAMLMLLQKYVTSDVVFVCVFFFLELKKTWIAEKRRIGKPVNYLARGHIFRQFQAIIQHTLTIQQ